MKSTMAVAETLLDDLNKSINRLKTRELFITVDDILNGPLPFKWLAIESIKDHIFSTQSDIWAYGVTIWEFFSLATTPYPGMEADEKLLTKLISGYRMEKPQYANQQVYQTMLSCWNVNPSYRPTFTELRCNFEELLEESVKNHYAYLNNVYITMNTKEFQNAGNDYLAMMSTPDYNNFSSLLFCRNSMNYVNSDALSENPGEGNDLGYVSMQKQQSDTLESATKNKETSSSGDRLRRKRSLHRSDQRQSIKKKLETAISFSNPTYNDLLSKSSAAGGYEDM